MDLRKLFPNAWRYLEVIRDALDHKGQLAFDEAARDWVDTAVTVPALDGKAITAIKHWLASQTSIDATLQAVKAALDVHSRQALAARGLAAGDAGFDGLSALVFALVRDENATADEVKRLLDRYLPLTDLLTQRQLQILGRHLDPVVEPWKRLVGATLLARYASSPDHGIPGSVIDALARAVADPDPQVNRQVVSCLAAISRRSSPTTVLPIVTGLLTSEDPVVLAGAIDVVSDYGSVHHLDGGVRWPNVNGLSDDQHDAVVDFLDRVLTAEGRAPEVPAPEVTARTIFLALRILDGARLREAQLDVVTNGLGSSSKEVRLGALTLAFESPHLPKFGDKVIDLMFNDPQPDVRDAAASALHHRGISPAQLDRLIAAATVPSLRVVAPRSLSHQQIESVVALTTCGDQRVVIAALGVLEDRDLNAKQRATVAEQLKSSTPYSRGSAARVLADQFELHADEVDLVAALGAGSYLLGRSMTEAGLMV